MTDTNSKAQVTDAIADAVLSWLVKHDLADAGNEYTASDVIEILNDLAPASEDALREAYILGRKGWCPASILEDQERTERDWQKARNRLTTVSAALAAQEKPEPGVAVKGLEWHRMIDGDPKEIGRYIVGHRAISVPTIFYPEKGWSIDVSAFTHWAKEPCAPDDRVPAPSPDLPEGEVARKFNLGDHVHKVKGASWTGHVVGFYSTVLTPIGYAVESSLEKGSVQIYPEAALEFSTSPSPIDKGEVK